MTPPVHTRRVMVERRHGWEGASPALLAHVFGVSVQRATAITNERCAKCDRPICGHTDAEWAGQTRSATVTIDTESEPGAWDRFFRQVHGEPGQHESRPSIPTADRDGFQSTTGRPRSFAVSPQRLCELVAYNPETGEFSWLPRDRKANGSSASGWNAQNAGKPALTDEHPSGYRAGSILGRKYLAHRVAWAISHGCWPDQVDHINGDRSDNRLANLREVNSVGNARSHALQKNNSSGVCGVSFHKRDRLWHARIGEKPRRYLGCFATREAAEAAYRAAAEGLDYSSRHGRSPSQVPA